MGRRFCVRCGKKESKENPIIDGLCPECFVRERTILKLPSKIKLTVCPVCGAVYLHGRWEHVGGGAEDAIKWYVLGSLVKRSTVYPGVEVVDVEVRDVSSGIVTMVVKGRFGEAILTQEVSTHLEVENRLCPACVKSRGGDYEAILQIRTLAPTRFHVMRAVGERLARIKMFRESIVEIKEGREGVDIKMNNQAACRYVANLLRREYAAKLIQTWENTGQLGNKRKCKLVISARLPGLMAGDIVEYEGEPAQVLKLKYGRVVIKSLITGKVRSLTHDEIWKGGVRYLSSKDYAIMEGRVLNYEGGRAVVQSVETGNIYFIKAPRLYSLGSRVKILIYKGKAYLLL